MRLSKFARVAACTLVALSIGGCGENRNDQAVEACSKAVAQKLSGKIFQIDRDDMLAHVKSETAETVLISSPVIFDKSLSSEYKQTFDCRVRFENAKTPDVIGLQFNWNKEDLKKEEN